MNKNKFDFSNKTAVITGGAQGFGLDIAKRFLDSGAKVVIWDIDPEMLEKVTKEINNPNLSSNVVDNQSFTGDANGNFTSTFPPTANINLSQSYNISFSEDVNIILILNLEEIPDELLFFILL